MKILFVITLVALAAIVTGCCSSQKMEKTGSSVPDTQRHPGQTPPGEGTSIKRNGAAVTAVVESVAVIDGDRYRIFVRLDAVTAAEGMDSPAEQGRRLVLSPEYALDWNGIVDHSNERNKRLLSLHSAKPGDKFRGTISMIARKGWVIVDVEKQ